MKIKGSTRLETLPLCEVWDIIYSLRYRIKEVNGQEIEEDVLMATMVKYSGYEGEEFSLEHLQSIFNESAAYVYAKVKRNRIKLVNDSSMEKSANPEDEEVQIETVEHLKAFFFTKYWHSITKWYKYCKRHSNKIQMSDSMSEDMGITVEDYIDFIMNEGVGGLEEDLADKEEARSLLLSIDSILNEKERLFLFGHLTNQDQFIELEDGVSQTKMMGVIRAKLKKKIEFLNYSNNILSLSQRKRKTKMAA